jgi:serine/threonine protein kinase
MVKKRKDFVGGTARIKNLSTKTRLEMHHVHPLAIKICTIPIVGKWFETCTGLEEYTKVLPYEYYEIDDNEEEEEGMDAKNLDEKSFRRVNSFVDALGSMRDLANMIAMNISSHQPNYIRINNYLDKQRKDGNYEPYYALKSIHLTRVNDPTFVNELRVRSKSVSCSTFICGIDVLQVFYLLFCGQQNEISIMKNLDHAHISKLIETYDFRGNIYMVMELCSGGDLYTRDPYTEDQAARIISSIMSAVAYMHEHDIMHRDLKYENIMFANCHAKAEIKIIDFGLSKKYLPDKPMNEGVGTIYTMSPEVLEGEYTNKADIWAIGVLAYMLLSSQMPFYGRKRSEIVEKIMKCDYDFQGKRWMQVSRQAKNFVADLLQHDPDHRPSAEEARQCLWLNKKLSSSVRTANEEDMEAVATSIENYSSHKMLRRLGLMLIAHKSTSEEIGRLRKVFKKYDSRRKGSISLEDFSACLKVYGWNDDYIRHLFECADLDGTGKIKYTEFLAATIESTGLVTEERIAEAFDRLDSDDSGYISLEDLREIFGDDAPEEYIEQVIAEADIKRDRMISYDEFLSLWDEDLKEREIETLAGINKGRTVDDLAEEILCSSEDDLSRYASFRSTRSVRTPIDF